MASEKGGRLVSAKARKIVQEFLSIISSPDTVLDKLDDCAIRMERVAEEVVPALAEAIDDREGKKRIGAAWFLINMAGPRPDLIQEAGLAKRAEEILVAALESDREGNRLFALTFLAGVSCAARQTVFCGNCLPTPTNRFEQLPLLHSLAAISLKRRTRQWGAAMPWRS